MRLLSPQHWAKQQKGKVKSITGEITNAQECNLQWGQNGQYKSTVPLPGNMNVATFQLAPNYKKLDIFCQEAAIDKKYQDQHPITVLEDSDNEEGERSITLAAILPYEGIWSSNESTVPCMYDLKHDPNGPDFDKFQGRHHTLDNKSQTMLDHKM